MQKELVEEDMEIWSSPTEKKSSQLVWVGLREQGLGKRVLGKGGRFRTTKREMILCLFKDILFRYFVNTRAIE